MPVNLAEFAAQIEAAKALVPAKHLELQKRIIEDTMTDIVAGTPDTLPGTPIRTGYARANWFPSVGSPSSSVLPPFHEIAGFINAQPTGKTTDDGAPEHFVSTEEAAGLSMDRLPSVFGQLQPFQAVYITNNVSYIQKLEDGYSKQAPAGMASVAVTAVGARYGRV